MGIDIYAHWKGQTQKEKDQQTTGFSIVHGHVGYLREAYHGGPYATRFLVREAFEAAECEAPIPAQVLRSRLPQAILLALFRDYIVYGEGRDNTLDATKPEEVIAAVEKLFEPGGEIEQARTGVQGDKLARQVPVEIVKQTVERIDKRQLPEFALSFVDFVSLCERKERETGEPCSIYASY